jgi:hypothetical protein
MMKPPAIATSLLERLGPPDDSFVGDLEEAWRGGRSRAWYWRQVLSAIVLTAVRQAGSQPARTLLAVATGWGAMLLVFGLFGDRVAGEAAALLFGWDRQTAYATDWWWPFWITSFVLSYTVFALSAVVVVRVQRRHAGPAIVAYAASMFLVLAASAAVIEALSRAWGRVPVPHTLFYIVSVAQPFCWRSGLVLAPLVVLAAGFVAAPRPARS